MTSTGTINKPFSIEKRRVYEAYKGDCQNFCVKPVIRHEFTNRSLNMTANCVFAWAHSRAGRFHSAVARFKTKYSSLVAASSEGKCPLVRTARRSFELSASMAFATGMRITVPAHPAGTALVLAYGVTIRDEGHREHVSGQADPER